MGNGHRRARLAGWDRDALRWVSAHRGERLIAFMRIVSRTGDGTVIVLWMALAFLLLPWEVFFPAAVASTVATGLGQFFKRTLKRARPEHGVVDAPPDAFSMPSGHTCCAVSLAVVAWGVAASPLAVAAAVAVTVWALLVATSRIVLGVHYPFDVLVGAGLGALSGLVGLALG